MRMQFTLLAVCLAIVASGCRGVRPEAGLPSAAFDGPMPKVTSNDRGFWFLVNDPGTEFKRFVELQSGERRELFYAVPKGTRTARLLPVSRNAYSMLDSARDGTTETRWFDTVDQAGAEFPDPVGWSDGNGLVKWAGEPPADGTPVALLAGEAPEDLKLSRWLLGTGVLKNGRLTQAVKSPDAEGPFVVVPDGNPTADGFRVRLKNVTLDSIPGVNVRETSVSPAPGVPTRYSWLPAALRSEGDLFVARHKDRPVAMPAHPVTVDGLALAVTDEPLSTSSDRLDRMVKAYRAVANGQFLAGSFWFARAQPASAGNVYAGALRALELIAAAGYVDWMRQAVLVGADGLDADQALYLARGHYVAGDFSRADDFATRAIDRFRAWRRPGSNIGSGRAAMLKAQIAARSGEYETAAELAANAAAAFDEVDDAMRAAEAELYASIYSLNASKARSAVKNAALARSRFFHGKSAYWSGFAEIALSDVYRRLGETGEAEKMARFAALRFDELGDEVARNRARIAEGRVAGDRSPAQGKRELEIAFDRATNSGDITGVVDSAASLVVIGAAGADMTATYGIVILNGMNRFDDPFVRERASQAIALLCSRDLPAAVEQSSDSSAKDIANARAACNVADEREASDTMVSALVAQGYSALSAGNLDEARTIARRARRAVNEELRMNAPKQAAEALFLNAVIERSESATSAEQTTVEGIQLLGESIDATRLASTYAEFANRFVARGQVWLASELFRAAVAAAGDQGQTDLRRELALQRVTVLHAAGNMEKARAAVVDAEPILESAGSASAPLLARLHTYSSDILHRLRRTADAQLAEDKARDQLEQTEGPTQVEITLLATRLAIERNDLPQANAKLQRAAGLEKGLKSGLVSDDERALLNANIATLRGELAANSGKPADANAHYSEAVSKLSSLATSPGVLRARIRALGGMAETATSDAVVEQSVRELEATRDAAARKVPALVPAAIEMLGRLEISAGRPSRALELVEQTRMQGAVPATTPLEALCLEARAAGLSGREGVADKLNECADRSSGARKVDAALVATFADPEMSARQRQRTARQLDASFASQLPGYQLQRLKLVTEVVVGTEKANDGRENRLRKQLTRAVDRGNASSVVDGVTDLAEYFIATGQGAEATEVVEENSQWFYEAGSESPGRLVRLQTQARVASLAPIQAFNFASRALSELPDISDADRAELLLAAATNDVLLGMWQQARSHAARALEVATSSRDRRLQRRIRDFAERFSLPLSE